AQNRGRKRAERFAPFNLRIQYVFDRSIARIGQNGPVSQSARPPFHSTLKPAHNFSVGERLSSFAYKLFLVANIGSGAAGVCDLFFLPIDQRMTFFFARAGTEVTRDQSVL